MTKPSSLEKLREEMDTILILLENHVASDVTKRIIAQISGTSPKARHHEAMQSLEILFRSHMETVIDEIIGSDDKQTNDGRNGEWVVSVENKLREEQRQRTKSYLEGEK